MVPLFVNDEQVGRVVIWAGDRPFRRIVRQMAPAMAVIGAGVLGVGTSLIALFVFGPVRRRLKDVQAATERLGAGDLTARAPDHGSDEVAALAGARARDGVIRQGQAPAVRGQLAGQAGPGAARPRSATEQRR